MFTIPSPSASAAANIPAVRMTPAIEVNDLDVAIASAIIGLKMNGETKLAGHFQRLMVGGSYAQKYEFVYGKGTYTIPKEFIVAGGRNKGIVDCIAKWACKTYTHAVTFYNCYTKPGETMETCDPVVKDVVEESCNWEC
ncbi:MAG: hypothetical protein PHV36_10730 [Elusimicrobiales bacterium]|nr:hypothetical protein [Elusimicrobiales bacterium]